MYDILVKVGADVTQFSKNMKGVSKSLSDISGNANKMTFGKLVGAVGITAAVAKGFSMVKNSVGDAVTRLDTLRNFPRVMERVGFSADESQKSIKKLSEGIEGLPTTLDDVTGTAQRIAIMTKDLDGAVETTLALNNAFLASGSDSAGAARGLEQYVQMLSKGEVDLQSWRTLQETMGVALNDVAESFGFAGKSAQNDLYQALKDGNITFDDFNGKIVEMSNKTGGFADIARDASGGIATAWTNVKTKITQGVANVIKAFDEFLATTSLGSIEGIFIKLKDVISDFFKKVAENVPVIINRFREFYEMISPFLPLLTTLAGAIGVFMAVVAGLNTIISIAASISGVLGASLGTLGAVFTFIISPIGLTILAIAGLVAAFVIAYQKVEWFRDFVDEAWAKIKEYFGIALDWIIDKVTVIMTEVWNFIKEILGKITAFWDENGAQIMALVQLYFGNIWEIIKMVMGLIKGYFQAVWPAISGVVKIAWNLIKLTIKQGIDLVLGIIQTALKLLKGDWKGAWTTIKETGEEIWDNIVQFFEDVDLYQIGADIIDGLIKGIGSMVGAVGTAVKNIGTKIKDTFTGFFKVKSPSRVMMSIAKHLPSGVIKGLDSMRGKVEAATERMSEAMTPDVPQVSMAYATPTGTHASLQSAINGTVDVDSRDSMLAGAIASLESKLTDLRVEMDKREVGRLVAPTVSETINDASTEATRGRGRRRL